MTSSNRERQRVLDAIEAAAASMFENHQYQEPAFCECILELERRAKAGAMAAMLKPTLKHQPRDA